MDKNTEKIERLAERVEILNKQLSRERTRVDRLVQVLRHNLPREQLDKTVYFHGQDCHGNWVGGFFMEQSMTLDAFLQNIIDP